MEAFYRDAETANIHDELVQTALSRYKCANEEEMRSK
jgi:hypothetical protein